MSLIKITIPGCKFILWPFLKKVNEHTFSFSGGFVIIVLHNKIRWKGGRITKTLTSYHFLKTSMLYILGKELIINFLVISQTFVRGI